jgi:hypothetical protein
LAFSDAQGVPIVEDFHEMYNLVAKPDGTVTGEITETLCFTTQQNRKNAIGEHEVWHFSGKYNSETRRLCRDSELTKIPGEQYIGIIEPIPLNEKEKGIKFSKDGQRIDLNTRDHNNVHYVLSGHRIPW